MRNSIQRFSIFVVIMAFSLLAGGCTINASLFGSQGHDLNEVTLQGESDNKILLLSIEGTIASSDSRSLLGGSPNTVESVRRQLDAARKDKSIKAILLRVNSPGGGATASDTIFNEFKKFKEDRDIPIVAFFQDMAASGGYYVSMCADEIVAQPTTITGSIGVIMVTMDITEMLEDLGIKTYTIRSGDFKAGNHPLVKKTDAHLNRMKELNEQMYQRFIDCVQSGRPKLSRQEIVSAADGNVYLGQEALDRGLIDRIGFIDDAIERTRELAGVKDASVVTYTTAPKATKSLYAKPRAEAEDAPIALKLADGTGVLQQGTAFHYLYIP